MSTAGTRCPSTTDVAAVVRVLRADPGRFRFASGGNGGAGRLAGELLELRTRSFALHIPYRGAGPAQRAVLSGEVQFMFDNLASAAPRIRDGRVVALAVTTLQPWSQMPDLDGRLTPAASLRRARRPTARRGP